MSYSAVKRNKVTEILRAIYRNEYTEQFFWGGRGAINFSDYIARTIHCERDSHVSISFTYLFTYAACVSLQYNSVT